MIPRVTRILAELRRRFEALYGERLVRMVLFGSHARGNAAPDSDIDVLVVLRGPVDPGEENARTGPIAADLSLQNEAVITCVFMSDERYRRARGPLLLNIQREGVGV